MLRDVLCGEKPLLFHREIYATAALIGTGLWLALEPLGLAPELRSALGFIAAFGVRAAAIRWGITMPNYQHPDS